MAYIVVENFSAGLDTRKHPLTAKPGTLQLLKNAHVSRGGEIEKRKKFATFASLPAGTFGMEAADNSIYVFGSALGLTMPAGVTYQRLTHPEVPAAAMTELVYSTLYGGKPFAIAKFSNGDVYPFWDGAVIGDFYFGISSGLDLRALAVNLSNAVNAAASGYTASVVPMSSSTVITVTGPSGTDWTPSYTTEGLITVTTAVTQSSVAKVDEVKASGYFTISEGTTGIRASSGYRTLLFIDAASLPGITQVLVESTPGFGGIVNWSPITGLTSPIGYGSFPAGATYTTPAQRLAYAIYKVIDNYAVSNPYGGIYANSYLGVYTQSGAFSGQIEIKSRIIALTDNGYKVWVEFDSNPTGVTALSELVDTSTIQASAVTPGRFMARLGTFSGGTENAIDQVYVDGVRVNTNRIYWQTSNSTTMSAVVSDINLTTSAVEYTASFSDGRVVLTSNPGYGAGANGRVITVNTIGNVKVGTAVSMAGGKDGVSPLPKIATYTLGGTQDPGKKVTLIATPTLDSANPLYWGASRVSGTKPVSALTFKTKAHITSGSSLFFSGVNQVTKWGNNGTGAGFINLSNNEGGNESLTALALYQGQLAAFARRSIQLWAIDTDPANNRQGQILSNTGTFAANSVMSIGEIDVFYLADSGVRSLRARDASNAAVVNDVGTPIDGLILSDLSTMTEVQKAACHAIIEPIDGRYWLAVGTKVYVYSYFPNSQVAAWSTYEPGFSISHFSTKDARVYARAGNVIYLYGGANNAEYDNSQVEVVLPYLDAGKPAHQKTLNGIDMTCEGSWAMSIGMDPVAPNARDTVATVTQPTFSLGRIMAFGTGTHVGIKLVNSSNGYARIANIIAHFDANESD